MDQIVCDCGATSEPLATDFFTFGLTVYMADLLSFDSKADSDTSPINCLEAALLLAIRR